MDAWLADFLPGAGDRQFDSGSTPEKRVPVRLSGACGLCFPVYGAGTFYMASDLDGLSDDPALLFFSGIYTRMETEKKRR